VVKLRDEAVQKRQSLLIRRGNIAKNGGIKGENENSKNVGVKKPLLWQYYVQYKEFHTLFLPILHLYVKIFEIPNFVLTYKKTASTSIGRLERISRPCEERRRSCAICFWDNPIYPVFYKDSE